MPWSRAPRKAVTAVPWSATAPADSRDSTTPRRSSRRTASGLMYSEQALSRGKAARSIAATLNPVRASRAAVALPAGPAPTTSASRSRWGSAEALILEAIQDEPVRGEPGEGKVERHRAPVGVSDRHVGHVRAVGAASFARAGEPLGQRLGDDRLPAGAGGVEAPGRGPALEVIGNLNQDNRLPGADQRRGAGPAG